jgi:uncharacterized protein YjlB
MTEEMLDELGNACWCGLHGSSTLRLCHTRDIRKDNTRLFCLNISQNTTVSLCWRDIALGVRVSPMVTREVVQPEQFRFNDDGVFPNSVLPLLIYRHAIPGDGQDPASLLEERFTENDWCNSWRNGIYPFAHYHSTTHEILGVYRGGATLRLGGGHGRTLEVRSGDVIVIPAGVAHQKLEATADFAVVGAYPDGRDWDLLRGIPGERPEADRKIAALPIPDNDPIYGADGPLRKIWKAN